MEDLSHSVTLYIRLLLLRPREEGRSSVVQTTFFIKKAKLLLEFGT